MTTANDEAKISSTEMTADEHAAAIEAHVADAEFRNSEAAHRPARPPRLFRVSHPQIDAGKSAAIEAPNEADAWALFCDKHQKWPSPTGRRVELVK